MGHLDASMANTCLQNPLLDFSAPRISAISNAFGTWMILFLALAMTLWGFRGIRVFCIGFIWWGKSAQVRVMLQSSSCSSFSPSGNGRLRETDGGGALLSDDLKMYRKMNLGDLELPSCREQATTDKGIHMCESVSKSKSSSLCDSLILCDASESEGLCCSSFIGTEMMVAFEKSLVSYSACKTPKSVPAPPLGDPFPKPVLRFPSFMKWECGTDSFLGSTFPRHNQVSLVEDFRCCGVSDSINKRSLNKSPFFSSLELIFQGGKGDKMKGFWFVLNDGNEEQKGEKLWMLDPVGFCKWKGLKSFESHYGLIKSGLARNKSRGRFGLNGHSCPECLIQDPNHSKVWQVNCERRPKKLLGITADLASSTGNVVRLWDVQVAQCLNETLVKDRLLMVNHFKDGYVNESLCSGIVARGQNSSLVVWDSRVFAKPVSYRLGNRPNFQSLHFIDNKVYFSDELNNTMFDLRMLGATPIEARPVLSEL